MVNLDPLTKLMMKVIIEYLGRKKNEELAESYKQSKANKKEREDNEAYLKEIKKKL